jgi:hypothetical protein
VIQRVRASMDRTLQMKSATANLVAAVFYLAPPLTRHLGPGGGGALITI